MSRGSVRSLGAAAMLGAMTTFDDSLDDSYDDEYPDIDEPFGAETGWLPRPGGVVETDEDAHEHLLALIGPERDGPRALWVLFLDDENRELPLVIPIGDLPTIVDQPMVTNLAGILRTLLEENAPGGCVAFALVRRGGGDRGTFEVSWAQALREAMAGVDVPVRAIVAVGRDRSRVLPARRAA